MFIKISFRNKLLIVFLAVGLIPFALMGTLSLIKSSRALSKQSFRQLESVLEIKKARLVDSLEAMMAQLDLLRDDPYVREALLRFHRVFQSSGLKVNTLEWKALAAGYDPRLKDIMKDSGWDDLILISTEGDIVYTARKGPDLGMIIPEGNLRESPLGKSFERAKAKGMTISDFAPYDPAQKAPMAFMAAQMKDELGLVAGYVAFPVPLKKINRIMQARAGMGETGKTYLVGPDKLMRSDSYLDPTHRSVKASFAKPALGSVDTEASRQALAGVTDTREILDFRGKSVLSAFAPVKVGDTTWALIAEIDKDEAFAAVNSLTWAFEIAVAIGILAVWFGALFLARAVTRPLGRATTELQTAAQELRVAAQQQLTSTKEQTTATTQTSTAMEELSASFKQISIAMTTTASGADMANQAANEGKSSLESAVGGMENIKKQVDGVVQNTTALGEKAHQMGLILEIINELADQTTVLSYNATIEAAGAGEAGRRFSAVAEQIMNLAHRAVDSTREIRTLIEDIQKSANKTVMATEDGLKAVDEGRSRIQDTSRHFDSVLNASEENLVSIKQMEMTVSQQANSVDQTAEAIHSIRLSAEEVETSSNQTLGTAEQMLKMAEKLTEI